MTSSSATWMICRTASGDKQSLPAVRSLANTLVASRRSLIARSQLSLESPREASTRSPFAAVSCGWSEPTASRSMHPGSVADSGTGIVPSLTDEGVLPRSRLMSVGSRLLLPPLLGRAGQRLTVSPHSGSLLLRHIGFPCPHDLSLHRAGYVGFPPLYRLRYREGVGSVGFPLPSSPGSFGVLRLSGGDVLAQLLSISLYCRVPITLQACLSPSYPWTLRPRRTQLAWNTPGLASPSSCLRSSRLAKRESRTCTIRPAVAVWCLFTLVHPTQAVGWPGR
jgi:hypothetical protein